MKTINKKDANTETLRKMIDDLDMSLDTVWQELQLTKIVTFAYQCGVEDGVCLEKVRSEFEKI